MVTWRGSLSLQLHVLFAECSFAVGLLREGLVGAAPGRPGDHERRLDPALSEARGDAADFLDGPAHQRDSLMSSFLLGGERRRLARWRTTALMAKASITSETCRCQPCQERVSLWVSPSSVLAVSNASSIAQRWPSTATSVSIGVPAGHQVEKNARS